MENKTTYEVVTVAPSGFHAITVWRVLEDAMDDADAARASEAFTDVFVQEVTRRVVY